MKIIIDLEFSGIDCQLYKKNEITQLKMLDIDTLKTVCIDFKTKRNHKQTRHNYLPKANVVFTKNRFFKELKGFIKGETEIEFIFFGKKQDIYMLEKYDLELTQQSFKKLLNIHDLKVTDLQELAGCVPKIEKDMILYGRSLEDVYFSIFGKEPNVNHCDCSELQAMYEIYQHIKTKKISKRMKYYPFGYMKGEKLSEYCMWNRRAADGYRFNNEDLLSSSLTYWINKIDELDDYDYDDF